MEATTEDVSGQLTFDRGGGCTVSHSFDADDQIIVQALEGETLVYQIGFLLAEASVKETPENTGCYEINFSILPPTGQCDWNVRDSSVWVPGVDCPGRFCLRIAAGTSAHDDGDAGVDWGSGATFSGRYGKEETVTDACHDRPIRAVHAQCPSNNAWAGSVEYSNDAGESVHPMPALTDEIRLVP